MLTKELFRSLLAIVALFGLTAAADAQLRQPGSRIGNHAPYFDGSNGQFLADELGNYDVQLFTPVDFGEQSVKERFDNTGLFMTFDRASLYVTAPETTVVAGQSAPGFNYQTWGNRYEIGYMTEADSGWTLTFLNTSGSTFVGGRSSVGFALPMQVETTYNSFELNKTFRQPLKNGALFEPFFGFRYLSLNDKTVQDGSVIATNPFFPTGTNNRFLQEAQNIMPGGQLGFRLFRNNERWTISGNAAVMGLYNDQTYFASDIINRTVLENIVVERANDDSTFVPGIDLRADIAYHITRDLALRAGGEVVYLADGLTRANILQAAVNPNSIQSGTPITNLVNAPTDQYSVLAGFTFGIEWRR